MKTRDFVVPAADVARFNKAVIKSDKPGGCWVWNGYIDPSQGYGQFGVSKLCLLAHRVAYTIYRGPIPAGLTLDHLCRNKRCVNPDHLEAVTCAVNSLRSERTLTGRSVRKVLCNYGHPLDGIRLSRGRPYRCCRTCERLRSQRRAGAL